VRTNFVDAEFALLQGAATFLAGVGDLARPHLVRIDPPAAWRQVLCSLPQREGGFAAGCYDELVDAPIYAGNAEVHDFAVAGRGHRLACEGGDRTWDGEGAVRDCARIVGALHGLWGFLPYESYLLLNILAPGGRGGLEHRDCSVLLADRFKIRTRKGHLDWLGLVAHEMFHAWNVKRLRPLALGPFDYEREVHTHSLWIAEGITSYYDDLLVHRAGLSTRKEYLAALSKHLADLHSAPGRAVQPLADASFDAWIKHYRQDENTPNSAVSYYVKGAVAAFLLDAKIRAETAGAASLDTVMRLAYDRWSAERGFDEADFRAAAEEVAGADLGEFFRQTIDRAEELDLSTALAALGLRQRAKPAREDDASRAFLGVKTKLDDGRLVVQEVRRDTPAWAAGLAPGDEIVALSGYRVPASQWEDRLQSFRAGEASTLTIARRERLTELRVTFGPVPEDRWRLEADPAADAEAKGRLESWLAG
jgi:predicted metalloprotease with PDZ domain